MGNDVAEYCKRCDVCQRVNSRLGKAKAELHPIPVSDVWKQIGIDLIGPLPESPRGYKYIITVTDYFYADSTLRRTRTGAHARTHCYATDASYIVFA
jgi:hypothetical protein